MGKKPGVMFYFEVLPCIAHLSDAQTGRLFRAMLAYAQTGEVPQLDDDVALKMAWPFVQLRLDQDDARYQRTVEHRRQAAKLRWSRHANAST